MSQQLLGVSVSPRTHLVLCWNPCLVSIPNPQELGELCTFPAPKHIQGPLDPWKKYSQFLAVFVTEILHSGIIQVVHSLLYF